MLCFVVLWWGGFCGVNSFFFLVLLCGWRWDRVCGILDLEGIFGLGVWWNDWFKFICVGCWIVWVWVVCFWVGIIIGVLFNVVGWFKIFVGDKDIGILGICGCVVLDVVGEFKIIFWCWIVVGVIKVFCVWLVWKGVNFCKCWWLWIVIWFVLFICIIYWWYWCILIIVFVCFYFLGWLFIKFWMYIWFLICSVGRWWVCLFYCLCFFEWCLVRVIFWWDINLVYVLCGEYLFISMGMVLWMGCLNRINVGDVFVFGLIEFLYISKVFWNLLIFRDLIVEMLFISMCFIVFIVILVL